MKRVYLDNAATTRVDSQVFEAMKLYFLKKYGVASSEFGHTPGIEAKDALEDSRVAIAKKLGAQPEEIVFTSGGTESNNLAIKGVAYALKNKGNRIITSRIEHHSVINTCRALEKKGFEVIYLDVDREGFVNLEQLEDAINNKTILVSIQQANQEAGTIQELDKIGDICTRKGVILHTDAAQSFTRIPLSVKNTNVDLISITAHKIHGPKGIGALYIKKGTKIEKIMEGGFNEFNLRAGTENIPGAVGFAKAVEIASGEQVEYVKKLRDKLIKGILSRISHCQLNGSPEKRLPNNVNVSFHFAEGESILLHLDMKGIAVTTGSACFSRSLEPSHVLMAMGFTHELAHGSVRYSLSKFNTAEEIDYTIEATAEVVESLRKISPLGKKEG
ncbi:MAG: cysteine desulfurase family protein [Candidatus Aerophobetes bacterium]|nr:cysteine desulfurase family protein [Candidatus Aerophobetes bacterium]